jgi:hypothetical protein
MKLNYKFLFAFVIVGDVLASYWVPSQSTIIVILAFDIIFLEEKAWEANKEGVLKVE